MRPRTKLDFRNLRTVKAIAAESGGAFTEGSLRWLIFKSAENGFDAVIVRIGDKVLIDVVAFNLWLAQHAKKS
jgi:hypothetical protein